MQTPRFSGQPCSAGDFVVERIWSRPWRTSCADVGTALPQSSKNSLRFLRLRSGKRKVSWFRNTKGQQRLRRNSQETPHRYQPGEHYNWSQQRGLLGFAGLAPHSGRSPVPFRLSMFRGGKPSLSQTGPIPPDKTTSIKKKSCGVKQKRASGGGKTFASASPQRRCD